MKYALVTSSTKGIGKAIGLQLLQDGYYVFFNYFNNDDVAKILEDELNVKYKNKFNIIKADLSNIKGVDYIYKTIKNIADGLDCVVFNTATTCYKKFEDIGENDWNNVMNTNLTIPFFLMQSLDWIINNNSNSRIIFISSRMGDLAHGRSIPYAVSKAGLNMLSKSLVKEYCDRNITINTISIGFADTTWHNNKNEDHIKRIENKIALKRFCKPEEVAKLCKSIIENDYINGATINIDGGYDMG